MRLASILLASAAIAAALPTLADPVPASALAVPPASAQLFTIMSPGGKHGTSARWVSADGTHMGRESMNLRGQIFELDSAAAVGADGMFSKVTVRGFTPNGDAAETFAITRGVATWKSPVDAGSAPYATPPATTVSAVRWISTPTWWRPWWQRLADADHAAGRQAPCRTAHHTHDRRRRRAADDHRLCDHWFFQRSGPGVGRRARQVLRHRPGPDLDTGWL